MMSPEYQGVFLALERGDFSKHSSILLLAKMGAISGASVRGLVRNQWSGGPSQGISAKAARLLNRIILFFDLLTYSCIII